MKSKGEALATILKSFKDCCFFLHNTKEYSVAERILNEGFVFESRLSRSTDRINPEDPVEVTYFMFLRKDYGLYTIIISFPRIIYEMYTEISRNNDVRLEEVLSDSNPYVGDNDELIYTLSPKHILGYFNINTSEFHQNRRWDPLYSSNNFIPTVKSSNQNIKRP
jgi:hypothetical protein